MHEVAVKLTELTQEQTNDDAADHFGRTAFNRHYYAIYLETRTLLRLLNPDWTRTPHKSIPELLQAKVTKQAKQHLKAAQKSGAIPYGEAERQKNKLSSSASNLASLLEEAYRIRVTADYDPDLRIERSNGTFSLNNCSIARAEHWHNEASSYCGAIRAIWRDLGLV